MMEKTLILKHISGMLCLLISYSKFTRTNEKSILTRKDAYNNIHIGIGRCQLRFAEMQETITGVAKS